MRHWNAIHFIRQFHFLDFFDPQVSFFTIFRHSEAKIRKNPKIKKFGKVNQQSCSDQSLEQVPRDDPSADPGSPVRRSSRPSIRRHRIRLETRFQYGSGLCSAVPNISLDLKFAILGAGKLPSGATNPGHPVGGVGEAVGAHGDTIHDKNCPVPLPHGI